MAEALLTAQDSFSCPVCLDLLKDPVTIPCGHSFCLGCIQDCWDQDDQTGVYSCPQCRQAFTPRPVLNKNIILGNLAEGLRKTRLQAGFPAAPPAAPPAGFPAAPPVDSPAGAGDVECDVCTGTKHKAVKSCLVCLLSFCEAHIQPHFESPAYKKHKLVDASVNLQEKICSQHDKLLEIFCRTDQTFLCYLCTMDEHRSHDTVSATAERTEKQTQFVETQKEFLQRIQQREKELQELRHVTEILRSSAQAAVEDSEKIFTELIQSMGRRCSGVKELIRAQEKTELTMAEELLKKLEQEIVDLRRGEAELKQLSHTDDHIHFLQSFRSLSALTGNTDLPSICVDPHFSFEDIRKAMAEMKRRVEDAFQKEVINVSRVTKIQTLLIPDPKTREEFLLYARDLTLDPNTVCRYLQLSEKNKMVKNCGRKLLQPHPDHPERFHLCAQVLCREGLLGRCYWEAEWSRNYQVDVAVAYKGINRKESNISDFKGNDQSWGLACTNSNCCSNKVGVYLDHRAGTLAFYSVTDTMTLIHRIQATFTEPLYPGFKVCGLGNLVQICNLY